MPALIRAAAIHPPPERGRGILAYNRLKAWKSLVRRISIAPAKISALPAVTYTGKAFRPAVSAELMIDGKTVSLKQGRDYTISYSGNKNPGKARVTISIYKPLSKKVTVKVKVR